MKNLVCIVCPKGCRLSVDDENGFTVTGNSCPRGEAYGKRELTDPHRTVTSTVALEGGLHRRLPVKTAGEIKKSDIFRVMEEIGKVRVKAPVKVGDVILPDIANTGVALVSAKTAEKFNQ